MRDKGLTGELVAEFFGTFILILLGDGVVANVGLAPRLAAPAYNWNTITIGWAFAVVVAVYVAGGVSGAPYESLMGRPIIYTEKAQTLGTAGDISFVDISRYIVASKSGGEAPKVATSIHLKFDYDKQAFRFTMRYDGQPSWTSALTPKYSSSTLSPFVVLNSSRT